MPVRLYVGNLPKEEVNRDELHALFAQANDAVTTKVIKDRKTGKCRGFAFVTVPTDELADEIIDKFNGQAFKEVILKIEKALPRQKGGAGEEEELEKEEALGDEGEGEAKASVDKPSKSRRKKAKKPSATSTTVGDSGSFQPDPRWAEQLAILKQRLDAQTTNT